MAIFTNFQSSNNDLIHNITTDFPFAEYISDKYTPLLDRIDEAQSNERLYIHGSTNMNISLSYDKNTFSTNLTKMTSSWFKNYLAINDIIQESLKDLSPNKIFELHTIENDTKDPNYIRLTSLTYSNAKTDQMWNFYLFKWGTPYVDFHVSRKDILFYN